MAFTFHSYYGLSVWFPDVIKHLQAEEYATRRKTFEFERVTDINFNFTLENQVYSNGIFINDRLKEFVCRNKLVAMSKLVKLSSQ